MSQRHAYNVSVVLLPNGVLHVILIMSLSSFKIHQKAKNAIKEVAWSKLVKFRKCSSIF